MTMFYDDPVSGNATCGVNLSNLSRLRKYKDVQVEIRKVDDIIEPYIISFNGKRYTITKVIGCRQDSSMNNAIEYGIKIGKYRTKVWKRVDGSWFVELR